METISKLSCVCLGEKWQCRSMLIASGSQKTSSICLLKPYIKLRSLDA